MEVASKRRGKDVGAIIHCVEAEGEICSAEYDSCARHDTSVKTFLLCKVVIY